MSSIEPAGAGASSDLVRQLEDLLGPGAVLGPERIAERATSYWNPAAMQGAALVRPRSVGEVSGVMKICHAAGQSIVVQGGLTGVVAGAEAGPEDVILSLEKMDAVESVDTLDGVAVVQAGAVLQQVQERVKAQGFLFPVDLGARGSCTIGGMLATNAGGINVLRYGMIRNLVLGLEAVLADGTVVSSMNQMLKNNSGYDIKQLFIGSEGTLGIVTRAVIKLAPLPQSRQTVMFAAETFDAVTRVLQAMRTGLGGTLSAYEVMWNNYFAPVTADGGHAAPLGRGHGFYVLAEAEGMEPDADAARFERLLERGLESGDIVDAVIPKSETERQALWRVREDFEPILPAYLYDVSLPIRAMDAYVTRLGRALAEWRPGAEGMVFGHIADGNLHIFTRPHDGGRHHEQSDRIVYGCLEGLGGSVSAEHGIGLDKKAWMPQTRSAEEIALMRRLKTLLDPAGILNPGRVFD